MALNASSRLVPDDGLPWAPDTTADVCLILEGTWPYVRGGVSTWVAQLLASLPELTFSVIFLGARADEHATPAYPVPANVVHLERHFLLEGESAETDDGERPGPRRWGAARRRERAAEAARFAANAELHTRLRAADETGDDTRAIARREVSAAGAERRAGGASPAFGPETGEAFTELLSGATPITAETLARHGLSWETIREKYGEAPPGLDFNHFFWTVRSMHAPLFTLGRIASSPPPAALYHSVSTGYAGWLGAMLKARTGSPYLISEHGIYTKERELDLAQVSWIPDDADPFGVGLDDGMSYLRRVWIRFFRSLGRMAYASADHVFTLHEGNRRRQLADGAPDARLSIIPNGVDVARFAAARREAGAPVPPVLALIGRIVPIKDIKTFVRAMRAVRERIPDVEGWLIGPEDEDPGYTEECRRLVASLDLEDVVRFHGFGRPEAIFPKVGLNVLTSVSEGQPLTVLEGFAAGVPALTTDVGSCRELIEGADETDRALGAAGAVVPIASPGAFADAAVGLLGDPDAWARASAAAVARVESRYDERDMIARYRAAYAAAAASRREAS